MSIETFDKSAVEKSLRAVVDPATNKDVVTLGMVKHIAVFEGAIRIVLELSPHAASLQEQLRTTVDRAVRQAAVVACATIETLEIADTYFGYNKPKDVGALFEVLETNHCLKEIDLSGNTYIDHSDIESLKACLKKNETLQKINLQGTGLKPEELASLAEDINKGRKESNPITIVK